MGGQGDRVGRRRLTPIGAVVLVLIVGLGIWTVVAPNAGVVIGLIVVIFFAVWAATSNTPSAKVRGTTPQQQWQDPARFDFGGQAERDHERERRAD